MGMRWSRMGGHESKEIGNVAGIRKARRMGGMDELE